MKGQLSLSFQALILHAMKRECILQYPFLNLIVFKILILMDRNLRMVKFFWTLVVFITLVFTHLKAILNIKNN